MASREDSLPAVGFTREAALKIRDVVRRFEGRPADRPPSFHAGEGGRECLRYVRVSSTTQDGNGRQAAFIQDFNSGQSIDGPACLVELYGGGALALGFYLARLIDIDAASGQAVFITAPAATVSNSSLTNVELTGPWSWDGENVDFTDGYSPAKVVSEMKPGSIGTINTMSATAPNGAQLQAIINNSGGPVTLVANTLGTVNSMHTLPNGLQDLTNTTSTNLTLQNGDAALFWRDPFANSQWRLLATTAEPLSICNQGLQMDGNQNIQVQTGFFITKALYGNDVTTGNVTDPINLNSYQPAIVYRVSVAAATNINTITPRQISGTNQKQIFCLTNVGGFTITLKNGVGNIRTPNDADLPINPDGSVWCYWDSTTGAVRTLGLPQPPVGFPSPVLCTFSNSNSGLSNGYIEFNGTFGGFGSNLPAGAWTFGDANSTKIVFPQTGWYQVNITAEPASGSAPPVGSVYFYDLAICPNGVSSSEQRVVVYYSNWNNDTPRISVSELIQMNAGAFIQFGITSDDPNLTIGSAFGQIYRVG
jgi:hypothetical protein